MKNVFLKQGHKTGCNGPLCQDTIFRNISDTGKKLMERSFQMSAIFGLSRLL